MDHNILRRAVSQVPYGKDKKTVFYCCLNNKVIPIVTGLEQGVVYGILIKPFNDHFKMSRAMIMLKLIYTCSLPTFHGNKNRVQ